MEPTTISRTLFLCHSIAEAIQKSSTDSISTHELMCVLRQTAPVSNRYCQHTLSSSPWFMKLGKASLYVWTINPAKLSENEAVTQRIANGDPVASSRMDPSSIEEPSKEQLLISRLVRHGLHISAHGFIVPEAEELLRKEFPGEKIFLHCPLLDPERKYQLKDYHIKYTLKLWSMDTARMTSYLRDAASNELNIRKAMQSPGLFPSMLRGQLKHGYDIPGHADRMLAWDVEVKEEGENMRKLNKLWPKSEKNWNNVLIALALKNSVSGKLSANQTMVFIERHFRGYEGYSSDMREVSRIGGNISEMCTELKTLEPMRRLKWIVTEASPEEEMDSRYEMQETMQQSAVKTKGTKEAVVLVASTTPDQPKRRPYKRYYKDVNDNLQPIDASWTRERNGVYFKHEISIDVEDLPPEGYYGSCSKK